MVKSTVEISQNFVAFSEYMNFKSTTCRMATPGGLMVDSKIITRHSKWVVTNYYKTRRHDNYSFIEIIKNLHTFAYFIARFFSMMSQLLYSTPGTRIVRFLWLGKSRTKWIFTYCEFIQLVQSIIHLVQKIALGAIRE